MLYNASYLMFIVHPKIRNRLCSFDACKKSRRQMPVQRHVSANEVSGRI